MQELNIIARIQNLCDARGWTIYRLARQSGITYSTLCTMLHKATAPSLPTLAKICRGFDITLSEFFDSENDWATLSEDQKKHLHQWSSLSKTDQQAIEKYMQYLIDTKNNSSGN